MNRLRVVVWREGVCMGDDVDTPHERAFEVAPDATISDLAFLISNVCYLAQIFGNEATWILDGAAPVAVFAQQWTAPRWLVVPETPVLALAMPGGAPHFEFRYWVQSDPNRVFEALRDGKPLPDRYGRE